MQKTQGSIKTLEEKQREIPKLKDFKKTIKGEIAKEQDVNTKIVMHMYREKINFIKAQYLMLEKIQKRIKLEQSPILDHAEDTNSSKNKIDLLNRHIRMLSDFIYEPEKVILLSRQREKFRDKTAIDNFKKEIKDNNQEKYNLALKLFRQEIISIKREGSTRNDNTQINLCNEAIEVLEETAGKNVTNLWPKEEDVKSIELLEPTAICTKEEALEITKIAFKEIFNIGGDYTIEYSPNPDKTTFEVDNVVKKIYVPQKERSNLFPVLVHEAIHLLRRGAFYQPSEYPKSPLQKEPLIRFRLLEKGTSRYLATEEGISDVMQALAEEISDTPEHNFSLLAMNLAERYNFIDTYNKLLKILKPYNYKKIPAEKIKETRTTKETLALKLSQEAALSATLRVFRGSNGKKPGVLYTKDIVYSKGDRVVLDLYNKDKDTFYKLFVGKIGINELEVIGKLDVYNKDISQYLKKMVEIFKIKFQTAQKMKTFLKKKAQDLKNNKI
ncbi:MAG: hypothetical protein ACD_63C00184G0003 [uncultured bacterium]|nr:MAG: hypothetical protein ACD_63C00184G0003 [uncultured bacterium]